MISTSGSNGDGANGNGHARGRNSRANGASKSSSSDTSLRDLYRIFFRHQRAVVYFFAATMLATTGYACFAPRTYRSDAKLFIRLGRENVGLDATTALIQNASVAIPASREEELNTVVEVLRSRALLDKVVDALGPQAILSPNSKVVAELDEPTQAPVNASERSPGVLEEWGMFTPVGVREQASIKLKKQIVVEAVKKTNIILISHEGPNPQVSQKIVTRLIDFYLQEHGRMNRTAHAHEFLSQQATGLKKELNALENDLRMMKNSTGLAAPAEQRQTLISQIGRLEDELKTTQATTAAIEAETRTLRMKLGALNETQMLTKSAGFPNIAADGMRQQLYVLQLKEKELASRVTDQHVELRALREQIAAAKGVVDSLEPSRTQVTTGPNRNSEELRLQLMRQESMLASLRARGNTVTTQLAAARTQLETLNNHEVRIAQLQREIQIRDASYRKYADGLEQSRIDDSLESQRISNINVAQAPTVSYQPVKPQPMLTILLGFGVALFGGVALAFGAEFIDHSFKTADDVESRLSLPVLVSIPQMRTKQLAHSIVRG